MTERNPRSIQVERISESRAVRLKIDDAQPAHSPADTFTPTAMTVELARVADDTEVSTADWQVVAVVIHGLGADWRIRKEEGGGWSEDPPRWVHETAELLSRGEPVPRTCEQCGALFTRRHGTEPPSAFKRKRFCSKACANAYEFERRKIKKRAAGDGA